MTNKSQDKWGKPIVYPKLDWIWQVLIGIVAVPATFFFVAYLYCFAVWVWSLLSLGLAKLISLLF